MALAGSKGSSQAQTQSSSTTTNNQTTYSTVDNSVHQGDFGAIQFANELSTEALRIGRDSFDSAGALVGRGLDSAGTLAAGALSTTERTTANAIDAVSAVSGEGFSFGRDALAALGDTSFDAIKAVGDAQSGVLDFAQSIFNEAIGANRTLTDSNLTGLTGLAKQTSASADDRVSKVAGWALAAVVAVFLIPAFVKGSK